MSLPVAVDFFFYGTLRDAGVRQIVFGRNESAEAAEAATLEGYRCVPVERGRFPAIVPQRGAATPGVLVPGISLDGAARVSYFEDEGAFYDVARKPLDLAGGRSAAAWVFIATAALPVEAGVWRFEVWERRCRPGFLQNAKAAMARAAPAELNRRRQDWIERLSRPPKS